MKVLQKIKIKGPVETEIKAPLTDSGFDIMEAASPDSVTGQRKAFN